jgi:hypothetical protein
MTRRAALIPLLVTLACACASLATAGPAARPTSASHPGFDTGKYPGEKTLAAWKDAAPYEWVGYYLMAPCHRDPSWVGRRSELARAGWGVAVLYVGQQAFENDTTPPDPNAPILCSRTLLTADRGKADAEDARLKADNDGFPRGSVVFLDVEKMARVPAELVTYYNAWMDEMLRDGHYLPGTYVHRDNASELYALARAAYLRAGRAETPPFWIASTGAFSLDERPFASGFPFATVWQGAHDVDRSWGGETLRIDENVATSRSPSEPQLP